MYVGMCVAFLRSAPQHRAKETCSLFPNMPRRAPSSIIQYSFTLSSKSAIVSYSVVIFCSSQFGIADSIKSFSFILRNLYATSARFINYVQRIPKRVYAYPRDDFHCIFCKYICRGYGRKFPMEMDPPSIVYL